MEQKMRVEYWNIDRLIPYENNPRDNDKAVEKVANSIREFGFQQPLVVDVDGVVVVGHTRLKAAQLLGLEQVPVVVAKNLTPAQAQMYRLADNKTNELASWNFEKLSIELDGLTVDFDVEDFGFTNVEIPDIDDLFVDADEQQDKPEKPKTIKCPHCGEIIEL